ncbi:AAEL017405-PA [Aedes aegypti]|uniref:AAEL017405-PA n=1 Tax=Aedes aegypti TaxID=7159 RepID=J9HT87_AEDAE|nr:AAEL017405-PA [Aedes aegypti]
MLMYSTFFFTACGRFSRIKNDSLTMCTDTVVFRKYLTWFTKKYETIRTIRSQFPTSQKFDRLHSAGSCKHNEFCHDWIGNISTVSCVLDYLVIISLGIRYHNISDLCSMKV